MIVLAAVFLFKHSVLNDSRTAWSLQIIASSERVSRGDSTGTLRASGCAGGLKREGALFARLVTGS
jgi:hypothetical protein